MAILKLEDLDGAVEVLVFPAVYQKTARCLQPNTVVLLKGRLLLKEETPKIIANDIFPIEEAYRIISAININLSGIRENLFESLRSLLANSRGNIPIYLHIDTPTKNRIQLVVGEGFYVSPTEKLIQEIEDLLGSNKLSVTI